MPKQKQKGFFEDLELWKEEWKGMPEFIQKDLSSFQSIRVHFETEKDRESFSQLINQKITSRTRSIWFPKFKNIKIGICTDKS